MVERRAATGELALLGGMARGRPALATVLMTTGVIALAVPLSTAFAGEFLILAGVFQQGWAWAVIGAVAIVLAAMYVLRLISAVLHEKVGAAVSEAALDLRLGELAVVVPLVALLLGLSAWPNAISGLLRRRAGERGDRDSLRDAGGRERGSPRSRSTGSGHGHAERRDALPSHPLRSVILPCKGAGRIRIQFRSVGSGGALT